MPGVMRKICHTDAAIPTLRVMLGLSSWGERMK
jgi:hypothetical protein